MKLSSKMLDTPFRRNEQHILTGVLENALIIVITTIAIGAAASILKEQILAMLQV